LKDEEAAKDLFRAGVLRAYRDLLDKNGHVIIPGLFGDKEHWENNEMDEDTVRKRRDLVGNVKCLYDYYYERVPKTTDKEGHPDPEKWQEIWTVIRDWTDNPPVGLRKTSRLTSLLKETNELLEMTTTGIQVLLARCTIEIVMMMLASLLKLQWETFDPKPNEKAPPLFAPDTGGRILATAPEAVVQIEHVDYYYNLLNYLSYVGPKRRARVERNAQALRNFWKSRVAEDKNHPKMLRKALKRPENEAFSDGEREAFYQKNLYKEEARDPKSPRTPVDAGAPASPVLKQKLYPETYLDCPDSGNDEEVVVDPTQPRSTRIPHPGYFMVFTGEEGGTLYSIPDSDQYLFYDDKRTAQAIQNGRRMVKITIPPWSMIIVRGDILHSGGGGEVGKCFVRLHMYIIRFGVLTPDSINERTLREKPIELKEDSLNESEDADEYDFLGDHPSESEVDSCEEYKPPSETHTGKTRTSRKSSKKSPAKKASGSTRNDKQRERGRGSRVRKFITARKSAPVQAAGLSRR